MDLKKAIDLVIGLVDHEFGDYSIEYEINSSENNDYEDKEYFYFELVIKDEFWVSKCNDLELRINKGDDSIGVLMDWDSNRWEKIEYYEWTIKYFWMRLLMEE